MSVVSASPLSLTISRTCSGEVGSSIVAVSSPPPEVPIIIWAEAGAAANKAMAISSSARINMVGPPQTVILADQAVILTSTQGIAGSVARRNH